jgi:catechol 2,3-dioxygenase-like lactoylglutathione lyase family enzyme
LGDLTYVSIVLDDAVYVGFIPVRDLESAQEFYCGVLGLKALERTPVALVVDAGGVTLRLTEVPDFHPQPFAIAGWLVSDISSTISVLIAAGVSMQRYEGMTQDDQGVWTAPSGDRVAWFADPDGNVLSVTAH